MPDFEFLKVTLANKVAEISLNRPDKANALHEKMWFEVEAAFRWADETAEVRAVILRSEGPRFCAGPGLVSEKTFRTLEKKWLAEDDWVEWNAFSISRTRQTLPICALFCFMKAASTLA